MEFMICDGTDMYDNFLALFLDFAIEYQREILVFSVEVLEKKNIERFLCDFIVKVFLKIKIHLK